MLRIARNEPVIHTGLLLVSDVDSVHVRRQLGCWVGAGKVYQLRGGLYALCVIRVLEMLASWRGFSCQIRMDNGPEMIPKALQG